MLQVKSVEIAGWEAAALGGHREQKKKTCLPWFACSEQTQEFPYVRVTLAHGLPQVGVDTAGVGVLNFCLGPHLRGGDVLHTHVDKAWNKNMW